MILKKHLLLSLVTLLLLSSNIVAQDYLGQGYEEINDVKLRGEFYSAFFKVHYRSQNRPKKLIDDDMVTFHIQISNQKDSVLKTTFNAEPVTKFLSDHKYENFPVGFLRNFMFRLYIGDSASYVMKSDDIFRALRRKRPSFVKQDEYIKYTVKILKRRTFKQVKFDEKNEERVQRTKEKKIITKYIAKHRDKKWKMTYSGIWYYFESDTAKKYLKDKATRYLYASKNDVVEIDFVASLLNGKVFCTTQKLGRSFRFPVGGQVTIPGLDEVLTLMKLGMKGRFIMPSYLAHGEKGIPEYNVPPNSIVIFDIEFKKIVARHIVYNKGKADAKKTLTAKQKAEREKLRKIEIDKMLEERSKQAEKKLGIKN